MKKKVLNCFAITVLAVSMLAGCGVKKEVDYSMNDNTELGTEELGSTENEGINDAGLDQFRSEENWVDQWKVKDPGGVEHNINIDADIVVPGLDGMRVIESQSLGGDEEFKKQCLKSFFGVDAEYYYHEPENYTKAELEKWLPEETKQIANASDTPTVAEEFESVSHYAGYRDDILYEIFLTDKNVSIWSNWDETGKCAPEQLRDYENIDMGGNPIEGEENTCKYSAEEAREIADEYMKEIGLSGMECTGEISLMWRGGNGDLAGDDEVETACYGYEFEYAAGIDGISFAQFPKLYQFQTVYGSRYVWYYDIWISGGSAIETQPGDFFGSGKARIVVTDDGIYGVTIENPEVIEKASTSVGLLPLNKVKEIMQNEVTERMAKYYIAEYGGYNHLQLMYLKLSDDTQENVAQERVTAIPVWCFSLKRGSGANAVYNHPIFVNAIDGTVIHFADAEWAGVDAEVK